MTMLAAVLFLLIGAGFATSTVASLHKTDDWPGRVLGVAFWLSTTLTWPFFLGVVIAHQLMKGD